MEQKFTQQSKGLHKVPRPQIIITLLLLLFISIVNVSAQDNTVSGTVLDEKGEGLIGVVITTKDGSSGTQTDFDGSYTVKVKDLNSAVLVFNLTGFKTQTVPVKGQTKIDVKMLEDKEILTEVVAVGYGSKLRPKVTEAISSVNSKELALTVNPSLENALQGRAAGVTVTQTSGAPGAASSVKIRGVGSVNGSEPLYVIDGVPVTYESINLLNPNDIQTVDILKDASATAIYGARGANGVVIITTKKGQAGGMRVSFDGSVGVQSVWKKLPLLKGPEYTALMREQYTNAGLAIPGAFNPDSIANYPYYNNNTDWQKAIFRTGSIQNYNINIGGGGEKGVFSISGGYFKNEGTVIRTSFERFSLRINSELSPTKWLKIGENVAVSRTTEFKGLGGDMIGNVSRLTPLLPVDVTVIDQKVGQFNWPNMVALDATRSNSDLGYRTLGNVYVEVQPIQRLIYRFNAGVDLVNLRKRGINEPFFSGQGAPFAQDNPNRIISEEREYRFSPLFEHTLSYSKELGKHDFLVLIGATRQSFYTSRIGLINSATPPYSGINVISFANQGKVSAAADDEFALIGYLARLNYSYASKYLLSVNVRRDGSSKFGGNNKFGVFPSFSVGWRPLEEKFVKNIAFMEAFFNDLKFRYGWGITGNQEPLRNNMVYRTYNDKIDYPFNGGMGYGGFAPMTLANANLRWEEVQQSNFGLDLSVFKNRFSLSVDYFIKNTNGMLLNVPIPSSIGIIGEGQDFDNRAWVNVGNLQNKGIEAALTYRTDIKDFHFSVTGNFSRITNELTKLNSDSAQIRGEMTVSQVGQPIGQFYGYKVVGIFQNQSQIDAAAVQNGRRQLTAPGDIQFFDRDGNNVIDGNDRVVLGNSIPKFAYGFNISADYKGVDLRIFFQGVHGVQIYNEQRSYLESLGAGGPPNANQLQSVSERWTINNPSTTMPRAVLNDPNRNARESDRWLEDASFLRLKSIQLGYSLPKPFMAKLSHSETTTARFYISVQNAFTFTKYSGYDPEVGAIDLLQNGIDKGTYPQPRTYMVGFQFGF